INVGETICPEGHLEALPLLHIDEPTLQMTFLVNNSQFVVKEVDYIKTAKIEERKNKQLDTDNNLREDRIASYDGRMVSGRREIHLSILIENMRREGYELQISKPQVIIKEIDGKQCEPIEEVQIDIPDEFTGTIMESIGERKGEMLDMVNDGNGQV